MRRTRIILMLALAGVVCLAGRAAAAQSVLWRIGVFNQSSGEFRSQGIDYNDPQSDPVYRVGESKDGDWQRFHPGPANGMAGGREHPFTIVFDHSGTPRGVYRLRLAVMYETPQLSFLRVELNGKAGLFYFQPKLDYGGGDWEGTFVPQTSADSKVIELSAEWLREGENRLVLTALDESPEPKKVLGSIAPGHSGLVYDALELSHDPSGRYNHRRVEVRAVPTIFYRQDGTGLKQVVDVFASLGRLPRQGTVELRIGRQVARQKFTAEQDFGERRWSFEVPEWPGTVPGEVRIAGRRFPVRLAAGKKWTVFVVPHEHLDIGFTDYPGKVAELHSQAVDDATAAMKRVPDFRWTLDGFWVAEQYLAGRSPEKQQEFLSNLRQEKIVLPLQYSNQHTGTASLEGLARSLYDAHFFAKKHSIPVRYAHTVDVPSYTWSYASVLNQAGVRYFLGASNNWRAPILLIGRWNEKSPFYWEGPDGGRVLMWYSRAYLQLHTMFGGPPQVAAARDALPVFLQAYSRPEYRASSTILFGSQLENTVFSKEQADFPGEWHSHYAWPRLKFASVAEALSSIEKEFDGKFPLVRGDMGPYWEDGFGSDARSTAVHRGNQQRILSAEKLSTLPALLDAAVRPDRSLLDNAWKNTLLFDEHTWTYVAATTQPEHEQAVAQIALKRARAREAKRQISESIHRSWAQLEAFLAPEENSIVVFNPLNWTRSGLVSFDLDEGSEIVDMVSGKPVGYETLWVGKGTPLPGFGGGYKRVRFSAQDVPALGYKLYAIRAGHTGHASAEIGATEVIENRFYRVTLDPASAAISSIWDKEVGRELVDPGSPYRFGAYLYVSGGDDIPNNSLYRYGAGLPPPKLIVHPAAKGRLVGVKRVPFGTIAVLESSARNTPGIRTEITLFDHEKKIGFRYELRKDRVLNKEAAYIAFPFAIEAPSFAYGNQTGWVNPANDKVYGGSREWHTVMHWMGVEGNGVAAAVVPLDAPLAAFGDIVRGHWPEKFEPRSGTLFSWLMNNYWGTNFLAWQGGEFEFRYVLFSDTKLDASTLTRRGWEETTPLESDTLIAAYGAGRLPGTQASLLALDSPNVILDTWKLAEDGQGSILRLHETAGKAGRLRISSPFLRFEQAWRCSLLEENRTPLSATASGIELEFRPFEILTIRVISSPELDTHAAEDRKAR